MSLAFVYLRECRNKRKVDCPQAGCFKKNDAIFQGEEQEVGINLRR